jgi:hypothetical protein
MLETTAELLAKPLTGRNRAIYQASQRPDEQQHGESVRHHPRDQQEQAYDRQRHMVLQQLRLQTARLLRRA